MMVSNDKVMNMLIVGLLNYLCRLLWNLWLNLFVCLFARLDSGGAAPSAGDQAAQDGIAAGNSGTILLLLSKFEMVDK